MLAITPLTTITSGLNDLEREASGQGFKFVSRFVNDWHAAVNRFDKAGERILMASWSGRAVGVGGLNVDPYVSSARIARLRHLYVAGDFRRRGIGEALVLALLEGAALHFDKVRLRTDTPAAACFYLRLGFEGVDDPMASHARMLG
ncbi:GNAT family N-acetyltransferase [Pinirhizobacter soli]|uniref:GNAT family N-acetyltransferase n=1 Tax=Pinirhizobacter soli TaxID=2786953 RepID=UPI00202A4216|nr:GNAT family N-acetyltransferase [Pinirhizobacter soli]